MTRTINVMCGKTEMDSIKHQLESLSVYRPKIAAIRRDYDPYRPPEPNSDFLQNATAIATATSTAGVAEEDDVNSDTEA